MLGHRLDNGRERTGLEEGWLLRELCERHGVVQAEFARRLARSVSWVSRRLALVRSLPEVVQEAVRVGKLSVQAATKVMVPLARTNVGHCERLMHELGTQRVGVGPLTRLYVAWKASDEAARERLEAWRRSRASSATTNSGRTSTRCGRCMSAVEATSCASTRSCRSRGSRSATRASRASVGVRRSDGRASNGRGLRLRAGRRDAARHLAARGHDRRHEEAGPTCVAGAVLLPGAPCPSLRPLVSLRMPLLLDRKHPLFPRRGRPLHDRQFVGGDRPRHRPRRRAGARDAGPGERFDFHFEAHAPGHANRSARVKRPFHYIENNFYPGREFADIEDLNRQLRKWCDRVNDRPRRTLPKTPFELLAAERPHLRPLPAFVPEVYDLHPRRVDTEGYVTVRGNRYSMPATLIGRSVEVRESMTQIRVFDGHRLIVTHPRSQPGARARHVLPEHVHDGRHTQRVKPSEHETLHAPSPSMTRSNLRRLRRAKTLFLLISNWHNCLNRVEL